MSSLYPAGTTGEESAATGIPSSVSELAAASAEETDEASHARRFEHYKVMSDETGKPLSWTWRHGHHLQRVRRRSPLSRNPQGDQRTICRRRIGSPSVFARGACGGQRSASKRCLGATSGQNRAELLLRDGVRGGRNA